MSEIFVSIPGYENRYEVSDQGRVRSLYLNKQVILKPETKRDTGYQRVVLCVNNVRKHYSVHTLVLLAFIGPPPYASWTLGDDNIWHSPNEPTEWTNPDTGNTFPQGEPFRVWSEADQEWTVQDYDTNPATDSDADFEALTAGGLSTYKWNGSVWVKQ